MSVVQAVVHHPAGAPSFYDAGGSKQSQGMGDVGLRCSSGCREVANAKLPSLEERVEEPCACRVAKETEELGEMGELVFGKQSSLRRRDALLVYDLRGTGVESNNIARHLCGTHRVRSIYE